MDCRDIECVFILENPVIGGMKQSLLFEVDMRKQAALNRYRKLKTRGQLIGFRNIQMLPVNILFSVFIFQKTAFKAGVVQQPLQQFVPNDRNPSRSLSGKNNIVK